MILDLATILDHVASAIRTEEARHELLETARATLTHSMQAIDDLGDTFGGVSAGFLRDISISQYRALQFVAPATRVSLSRIQWLEDEHARLERYAEWM